MDRCRVFVVTYSVVLIILFCVFCYLISTVEPPPLSDHQLDDLDNHKSDPISRNSGSMYDDVVIFDKRSMHSGDPRFTLKEVDAGDKTTESNSHGLYKYETRRVSPPIMPPPELVDMFNNRNASLFHKILFSKQTLGDATQIARNKTVNNSTPPKLRRRSVKDFNEPANNESFVKLHIMDNTGLVKLEIKLCLNSLLHAKRGNTFSTNQTEARLGIEILNGNHLIRENISLNTTINIMANNTVTIGKAETYNTKQLGNAHTVDH